MTLSSAIKARAPPWERSDWIRACRGSRTVLFRSRWCDDPSMPEALAERFPSPSPALLTLPGPLTLSAKPPEISFG